MRSGWPRRAVVALGHAKREAKGRYLVLNVKKQFAQFLKPLQSKGYSIFNRFMADWVLSPFLSRNTHEIGEETQQRRNIDQNA